MLPSHTTVSPTTVQNALAQVNVTHTEFFRPAVTAAAWDVLKQARGQSCNLDMLATPAHLIRASSAPAAPPAPGNVEIIDATRARIIPTVRARIAHQGYRTHSGGDAA